MYSCVFLTKAKGNRQISPATNRDLSWSRRYEVSQLRKTTNNNRRSTARSARSPALVQEKGRETTCACAFQRGKHAGYCHHRRRDDAGSKVGLESEGRDGPQGVRNRVILSVNQRTTALADYPAKRDAKDRGNV